MNSSNGADFEVKPVFSYRINSSLKDLNTREMSVKIRFEAERISPALPKSWEVVKRELKEMVVRTLCVLNMESPEVMEFILQAIGTPMIVLTLDDGRCVLLEPGGMVDVALQDLGGSIVDVEIIEPREGSFTQ